MSDTDMLSDAAAVLSNASNNGIGSPHTQAWSQAMQLEKRLKGEARKRSFWDPEVGGVREGAWGGFERQGAWGGFESEAFCGCPRRGGRESARVGVHGR